jgi:hypothetical protein
LTDVRALDRLPYILDPEVVENDPDE